MLATQLRSILLQFEDLTNTCYKMRLNLLPSGGQGISNLIRFSCLDEVARVRNLTHMPSKNPLEDTATFQPLPDCGNVFKMTGSELFALVFCADHEITQFVIPFVVHKLVLSWRDIFIKSLDLHELGMHVVAMSKRLEHVVVAASNTRDLAV